jgi:hypothetical protein
MSWTSCNQGPLFPSVSASSSALSSDHFLVLIDTACRPSFQHLPDRPDFTRTDWANFQTHLEDQPEFLNEVAIDMCVEYYSVAVLKGLAASTLMCRPREDPRPSIPAGIQNEIV